MGAALLEQPEQLHELVRGLVDGLPEVPVSVKLRTGSGAGRRVAAVAVVALVALTLNPKPSTPPLCRAPAGEGSVRVATLNDPSTGFVRCQRRDRDRERCGA